MSDPGRNADKILSMKRSDDVDSKITGGKSLASGPAQPPIPDGTIGDWLHRASALFGEREAVIAPWQDVRWTWAELRDRSDFLARGSGVFGIPDEQLGEQVCAWIRAKSAVDAEEIRTWCKGQISHHKIPRRIRIVDAFPMIVTGKIQKFAMRDQEQAEPD